ncbi:hypothetical protein GCM10009613_45940 [Pseudonocardia kongjuensis]|uniref:Uncharacterized protein n=1 Tax=Pseudonocardia kongjuensis TaxID=102227 RepID=A0ABN1Y215_9PSEU
MQREPLTPGGNGAPGRGHVTREAGSAPLEAMPPAACVAASAADAIPGRKPGIPERVPVVSPGTHRTRQA